MGRRPTVYDVAARAGVSIATVSFAFSQPERVRQSTLDAVLAAARALGYVPSGNARGLAKGRTGAIGLYSYDYLPAPGPRQPSAGTDLRRFPLYVDEVQWGVQLECREQGYALMLGAGNYVGQLSAVIDIAGRVDGLIALPQSAPMEAVVQVSNQIPVVQLGEGPRRDGIHTVVVDNHGGMRALTEHLTQVHDFERITYLGDRNSPEFVARFTGYSEAMAAAGLAVPDPIDSHPRDAAGTAAAVEQRLRAGRLPEVLVCGTDQEALVAIDTLAAAGIDVPTQVAVTGFDGTLAGWFATPRLTTVRQPMVEIGRTAVRLLADLLGGSREDAQADAHLDPTLVLGSSCGCQW